MTHPSYPAVLDSALVGTYPASAKAGGGYVWDAVLEYRVWCYPERGASDLADGDIENFDFSLPGEVTDYLLSVRFNDSGEIDEISMES